MTPFQEQLSEMILAKMREHHGKYNLFLLYAPKMGFQHKDNLPFVNEQLAIAKQLLKSQGYIEHFEVSQIPEMYILTKKGSDFKNFTEEKEKDRREEYMKGNAYMRAKYWWAIGLAGILLGILTPIAVDKVKSLIQQQTKVETTTTIQKESDTSLHN